MEKLIIDFFFSRFKLWRTKIKFSATLQWNDAVYRKLTPKIDYDTTLIVCARLFYFTIQENIGRSDKLNHKFVALFFAPVFIDVPLFSLQ